MPTKLTINRPQQQKLTNVTIQNSSINSLLRREWESCSPHPFLLLTGIEYITCKVDKTKP